MSSPLTSEWREAVEADLASEFDEAAIEEVETELRKQGRLIEKYSSPAWTEVFNEMREEQQQAFKVMMATDDEKLLLTAREKARLISKFVERLKLAEESFERLSHQRQVLTGEVEEEE